MSFKLKLQPIATCHRRKVRYYSQLEAETAIEIMKRFYGDLIYKDLSRAKAYQCKICRAWHFGDPDKMDAGG